MRSQRHYYDDARFFFIEVESSLFHVPFALLAAGCQVFADCRDIPHPEGSQDGISKETPLLLPSITADEFRAFLEFLFPSRYPQRFSPGQLEAILRLSDMYGAQTGFKYAVWRLSRTRAPAPRLLALSIKYRVREWFVPAFRTIASFPLEAWKPSELEGIPVHVLDRIKAVRRSVNATRKPLVDLRPIVYMSLAFSPLCTRNPQGSCVYPMMQLWNATAQPLIADKTWHTADEIRKTITSAITHSADVCPGCRPFFKRNYCLSFSKEERLVRLGAIRAYNRESFGSDESSDLEEVL